MASDISTPGHTCNKGGGLAPAPTTSSNVNNVNQSWPVWIFAALVRNNSCKAYEICRVQLWITDGFIISRIRSDVNTWDAISSRRSKRIDKRKSPTTVLSTKNVCSLELTSKLYTWSRTACHIGATLSLCYKNNGLKLITKITSIS